MTKRRSLGTSGAIVGLILIVVLAVVSCAVGSRSIPLDETWAALRHFDPTINTHLLVREVRVPRTFLAIVVGAALGLAGALMQALTRNPLAEPGILGINAGAAVAVTCSIAFLGSVTPATYMLAGFIGAAGAAVLVYALGRAHDAGTNPVRLVLAGAGISVLLGALTSIIIIAGDEQRLQAYAAWATGSLQGRGYDVLPWVLGCCVLGIVIALSTSSSLDSLALGQEMGKALGVKMRTTWTLGSVCVLLLAGSATAAAGPVAFIGLAAPHVARLVVGTSHRSLLPYSMMLGALLLLCADVVGRIVVAPAEVGAGVMSALIGAPFFIALARRRKMSAL